MQEDASISFDPVRPAPLEKWHIVLALIVFLVVIAAIIWGLRKRPDKTPGTLNLDGR
jgi:hypothetical protein